MTPTSPPPFDCSYQVFVKLNSPTPISGKVVPDLLTSTRFFNTFQVFSPTSMDPEGKEADPVSVTEALESLRRKRATRRGSLTRLHKKVDNLRAVPLAESRKSDVEHLKILIKADIEKHQGLQDQIKELIDDNLSLESTSRDQINDGILKECRDLLRLFCCWEDVQGLIREADFLDKPFDCTTAFYQADVKDFAKRINATQTQAINFRDNQELADVFTTLWKRAQYYRTQIDRRLTTFTPMDSASTSTTTPTVARAAQINVELPKFDGDPLQWRKFYTMFTVAITTRADGFSELDKKCLLSNFILPKDVKDIVDNAPKKEYLSQLLERLKRRYGRPQVVVSLLIKKMDQPQSFSFDYEGVQRIHTQKFQGYDALEPYMEDSLSSYLLHRTTMSLTPAAKKIWDNAVTKKESQANFRRLQDLPGESSNQSNSNPSSSSASFTSSPSPAKNKVKFNPKSLACEDKHGLNQCSVFAYYNIDRRNEFVRDKRLCMNCFSDTHGFKNCRSRFTCRSCGQRHHTLIHKDSLEPTVAYFSLAVDKEETEVPKVDANISPTFSNTIIVSISNRGKTMKVKAILDSGANVSLTSSSLATSPGLKRIPHSLSFTGSFGSGRSTYCVKTSLHSDDSSFASTPFTFSVLPKLNPLLFQSTRSLSQTYPQSETFTSQTRTWEDQFRHGRISSAHPREHGYGAVCL